MAEKIKLGTNGNFGVKEGGTLAYNDENGVFKAIELASSRASGATYVAESGLIADAEVGVPRIDWTNGVGELLLEPQRRNLVTRSEDFSTSWTAYGTTSVTINNGLSPDGSLNADEVSGATDLVFASNNLTHFAPVLSGVTYFGSVYVKLLTATTVTLRLRDGSTGASQDVTTTDNSGWVRVSVPITTGGATTSVSFIIGAADGTFQVFGAQLEDAGAGVSVDYATSYIRTSGSSVTRIADAVTGNSSLGQVINSSEGVLYAEMSALADDLTFRSLSINNGSNSVLVELRYRTTTNRINFLIKDGVNPDINEVYVMSDITDNAKFAVKYKSGDIAFWVNGTEVFTGTNTISLSGLDTFSFNNDGSSNNPFYGRVRELKVYDTALTDAELTTLTTL